MAFPTIPGSGWQLNILAELHSGHYTRYPDNRKTTIPDISNVADDVVDRLIVAVSPSI